MPTAAEIRALLPRLDGEPADALETETLEFKPWEPSIRDLHRLLREYVVCLANAKGGTIVLGVRDRVKGRAQAIQGAGAYDPAALRRAVYDGTDPHILVDVEDLVEPEGRLVLVHVPRGIPPHTTSDGMARIRVGTECKPLTGGLLAALVAHGGHRDLTAQPVHGATLADLDPSAIAELRAVAAREGRAVELSRLDDGRLLSALGLLHDGNVSLACLLLAGRNDALARHAPQHEVTFVRYRTATRYDQRRDLRGPLILVLRDLEALVSANNRIRTLQEKGFGQLELPDLSWEVAREAVLNAIAHRDYFMRQGVQVALYGDRLEVVSPGGFVGGITPENVLRHPPVHRNELLARALQAIGVVNRVGLGVDRIYEGLLRLGKDIPRYSADESHVRLVVPVGTHDAFALFVAEEQRRGRPLDLDGLLVLRSLVRVSALDRWSAARVLQLPEDSAADVLIRLREAGYLVVRGRGRGTAYALNRELARRLRGKAAVDAEVPLQDEGIRLRILALLEERGSLTNQEIREFSGLSRAQVYRLLKGLEAEGRVRFVGHGRGARVVLARSS